MPVIGQPLRGCEHSADTRMAKGKSMETDVLTNRGDIRRPFIVARAKAGAIRRLVTSIVLISVSMLLATGIVLAVPADEWAPPVRTGVWDAVVLQHAVSTPALPSDSDQCVGSASEWVNTDDQTSVVLRTYRCDSQATARRVAGFSVEDAPSPRSVSPTVFGDAKDYAYSQQFDEIARSVRFWAQGQWVRSMEVYCDPLAIAVCEDLNVVLSRDLAAADGQQIGTRDSGALIGALVNVFFAIPATGWFVFVGVPGLVRWTSLPRFNMPQPPPRGWRSLDATVRSLKRRSIARGSLIGLRRALFICLGVVIVMLSSPIKPDFTTLSLWTSATVLSVALVVLYWLASKLSHAALSVGTEWRSSLRRGDRGYGRFILGHLLRLANLSVVLFMSAFFVVVFLLYYIGGTHSNRGQRLIATLNNRNDAGQRGFVDDFVANALSATHMSAELALLLPVLAVFLLAVDRLGLRFLARSIQDVTERGLTPHVLYLRSFGRRPGSAAS